MSDNGNGVGERVDPTQPDKKLLVRIWIKSDDTIIVEGVPGMPPQMVIDAMAQGIQAVLPATAPKQKPKGGIKNRIRGAFGKR